MVGGFRTVAYVEYDRYAQAVLMSRMRDGGLDDAPIFEDVRTFDGRSLAGSIDVVSGGFPCQDLSLANKTRKGLAGDRSGLWREYARIVSEVGPRFVLVENVAGLFVGGGIGIVLGGLSEMGYDARWYVLSAGAVGAPHLRERVWIVAHSRRQLRKQGAEVKGVLSGMSGNWEERHNPKRPIASWTFSDPNGVRFQGRKDRGGSREVPTLTNKQPSGFLQTGSWMDVSPSFVARMDDGMGRRVERSRLCGNGVVPQQSVPAWKMISEMGEI